MACETGTNIFSTGAGTLVAVDGEATPFAFAVDGQIGLFNDLKGVVTSVGLQSQSGFQFMHALREFIYVYVFTERVGEIVVSGLVFPEFCGHEGTQITIIDGCQTDAVTGLERLIQWYECNRITTRSTPITVSFGDTIGYDAFLVGMKADIVNADTGIAQFSFRFSFVPNVLDNDGLCFPFDETCLEAPCDDGSQLESVSGDWFDDREWK